MSPDQVGTLLRRWRTDRATATAIRSAHRSGWQTLNWADLADAAECAAARARALIPATGPVVVVIDNSAESVCSLLGLWQAGADTLLLEHAGSYLTDSASAVWNCGASALVGPAGMSGQALPGQVTRLRYIDLLAGDGQAPGDVSPAEGDREASVLQLTSGATGEPRIAAHPLANLVRGGELYRDIHQVAATDLVVVPLPLAHSFGVVGGLMTGICAGAEVVTMPRLMLGRLAEATSRPGVIMLGTPLLYRLATTAAALPGGSGQGSRGSRGRSTVKSALCSGGPLPAQVAAAAKSWLGADVFQVYGSTETGLISCEFAAGQPWPAGSAGTPAPGVTVRFADRQAGDDGGAGIAARELLVRTSTMLTGYHGAGSPLTDGYFRTGDLGVMDAEGRLYLAGRKATFINVGGRKVNAARLERLVRETGLVSDIAVYGVDQGDGDEEIHAAIELAPGARLHQVAAMCRGLFSSYEIPHAYHVLDQLPRGPLGKVQRERLPR